MQPLIIFDLDNTLAESKQPLSHEMATYLTRLLSHTRIAIISGGALTQFTEQVVKRLPRDAHLQNLYLLPTSGAALYEHVNGEWKKVYEERLSEKDAATIRTAMEETAKETRLIDFSSFSYGDRIEYRGSQVTLSALGQLAPVALKKEWDPSHTKRRALQAALAKKLPDYLVVYGGSTSVDVTKRGIDKAYGIHQLCERLHIKESDVLYIGDELQAGGNDEAVFKTGVSTCAVANPTETVRTIQRLLLTVA